MRQVLGNYESYYYFIDENNEDWKIKKSENYICLMMIINEINESWRDYGWASIYIFNEETMLDNYCKSLKANIIILMGIGCV